MKEKRVLLITSRKSKVKETSHKLGIADKLDLNALANRDLGCLLAEDVPKYQNCVCNNSHIEKYWKYQFDPQNEKTFLWKCFDVIVVDEAHSLATDASFSDAPFHLYSFLNYVFKQKRIKLIFMTATPAPKHKICRHYRAGSGSESRGQARRQPAAPMDRRQAAGIKYDTSKDSPITRLSFFCSNRSAFGDRIVSKCQLTGD